jgi:surfactin synthase thioesterase subunit
MLEPLAVSIAQIIAGVNEAFCPYRGTPVALFGHSLGALTSFEFARRLRALGDSCTLRLGPGRATAPQP